MIPGMAIEIDGVEYLTTAEAVELSGELGTPTPLSTITAAARRGRKGQRSGISGSRKMWDSKKAPWLIPHDEFVAWLKEDRRPGPKPE